MENEKEEFNKSLKLLVKSSLVVSIAILLSKLSTWFYRIIIAKHFGAAEYGLFTLAIMITGWFVMLSNIGLNQGLIRFIPIFRGKKRIQDIKYTFKVSFKITAVTSILAAIILFFASEFISIKIFHEPNLILFLKFFAVTIPLTVLLEIILAVFLAYEEIGWYSFVHNVFVGFSKVFLIGILILLGFITYSIFFSYIFSLVMALVLTLIVFKSKFSFILDKSLKTEKENKKKLFSDLFFYSWPLLFYSIIWQIFHWTDSFIIGIFKTATDVGIYNVAVLIAFLLTASAQVFMQLFFPLINKEYSKDNKEVVKQLTQQVGKWIFMINLPLFALLILFPSEFLGLFGIEYLAAKTSLILLSIGTMFFSIFNISNSLIAMKGNSKIVFIDICVVFLINMILNIIFIRLYGITGSALATMISLILLGTLFVIQSRHYLSIIPIRKKMMNLVFAMLFSSLILYFLKPLASNNILFTGMLIVLFFASYILFAFLFKGFDRNDMMILKVIFKKIKPKNKILARSTF